MTEDQSDSRTDLIFIIIGFIALALFGLRTISTADFWFHLASGSQLMDQGIPRTDTTSFTAEGVAVVNTTWLYDGMIRVFWGAGGAPIISLLHVFSTVGAFCFLLPVARKWCKGLGIGWALLTSAWLLATPFEVSPSIFSLLFVAVFVYILSGSFATWVLYGVLLPVQLLWTNMHSSFLFGPFMAIIFAIEAFMAERKTGGAEEVPMMQKGWVQCLMLTGGLILITLLNPYGILIHGKALGNVTNVAFNYVHEWISPFVNQYTGSGSKHMLTVALLIGGGGLVTQRQKLPIALTTLAVLSAFLSVRSITVLPFFSLMAFPFFCLSFGAIGDFINNTLKKSLQENIVILRYVSIGVFSLLILFTFGTVVSNNYYNRIGSASGFGLGAEYGLFPEEASEILNQPVFPRRNINLATDGGFLRWKYPQRQIFVDQKADIYGVEIFQQQVKMFSGSPEDIAFFEETWNPEGAIINCCWPASGTALRALLSTGKWALAYFDGSTVVLLKAVSGHASMINDSKLHESGLRKIDDALKTYLAGLGGPFMSKNPARLIGAGNIFISLERYKEAYPIYWALTQGAPTMDIAWLRRGICEFHLGLHERSVTSLEKACKKFSKIPQPWLWLSRAYAKAERQADALTAYERAQRMNPELAQAFGNPVE